ncbi:hypothetical protein NC652_041164 [Populus alba x Populus x berolinensis]|nr:hypothetical protein NC652_041164 [Populus alba x Populus x berolinensis]
MANPKEEDIERVRLLMMTPHVFIVNWRNHFRNMRQGYFVLTNYMEALLHLLKRQNSERNHYYWNLDRQKKNLLSSSDFNEESKKRKTGETMMVSFLTSIGQTKPSFIYQMFISGDSSLPSVNGHDCQTEWLFLYELVYESYSSIFFKTHIT